MARQAALDPSVELSLDTIKIGKQALLFVGTRPSAEKMAEDIARQVKEADPALERLALDALEALSRPTRQCERLAACLRKGIAFHHSGLTGSQKTLIEDGFREGKVRIIACTPTLAAGVDLPAYRAIIRDLKRFGMRGMAWIPVLEYLQMAGRAGRPKYDTRGEAIIIASTESEAQIIHERYVKGEPEDIYSKLAVEPVLRTYVLSMVAANVATTRKGLHEFFMKTFWAHQFKDERQLRNIIDKMLKLLGEWGFAKLAMDDFMSADELEEGRISATELGKRVAELYLDPLTARMLLDGMKQAKGDLDIFPIAHLICCSLEMRPLLRVKAREMEEVELRIAKAHGTLLAKEPSRYEDEYEDFVNAIKTAGFFDEWADEKDEEWLLEKFDIRPGEVRAKIERADWLLYSLIELCRVAGMATKVKDLAKTRIRLRYGVKEELLALLRLKGIGRVRARKLYNNKIRDVGDIKKADLSTLKSLLGEKTAEDVKKQVSGAKAKPDKEQSEMTEFSS